MTPNRHDVAAARAEANTAKARLFDTLAEVQDRLTPAHLAQNAVESAVEGVASVARKGRDAVRNRPLAAAGVASLFGLFMARSWIGDILSGEDETSDAPAGLKSKSAPRAKKGSAT